jgi:nucleoside-diphosphate-sugar epimerase
MADQADVQRVFAAVGPDIVVHLSGSTGAQADRRLVLPMFHSLATSTVNVLVAASEQGCRRVLLAGSLNEPIPSLEPAVPGSPYAAAKWIGSTYGRMFHRLYGTPVVIMRPFMAYGPGQAHGKLIPSVVLSLRKGEAPRLSSGNMRCDWSYIDDVIDAFILATTAKGVDGQTFDLGFGTLVSIRDLVEKLVAIVGSPIAPQFGALPDRPLEHDIAADTSTAAEKLGWRATTNLEEGLRRTADWYSTERAAFD